MKICVTQGIIAIVMCSVTIAHDNYAQLLDTKVDLSVTDVSFDEALSKLASTTQAKFAYSPELLNVQGKITIHSQHKPLRQILDEILEPRNIKYFVHKDGVTISLKRKRSMTGQSDPVGLNPMSGPSAFSSMEIVSGVVTDVNKQPLPGVNILIKGSTTGTTSDANGKFSIEAAENDILVFSFIGYSSQEVKVHTQTTFEISLSEDIKSLGEVIVNAGYWQVSAKEQTGNISRITTEEIQKQPISNPLQAMQGRNVMPPM